MIGILPGTSSYLESSCSRALRRLSSSRYWKQNSVMSGRLSTDYSCSLSELRKQTEKLFNILSTLESKNSQDAQVAASDSLLCRLQDLAGALDRVSHVTPGL